MKATALDTLQNGFRPIVAMEVCGDRDEQVQLANLFDLGQKYADLKNLMEIQEYLESLVAY